MSDLLVSFAGEQIVVKERLTFGRSGDLEIDSNLALHRLVGEFVWQDGMWWLRNLGSRLFITLIDPTGSRVELAPRSAQVLAGGSGVLRISVGQARYEIDFEMSDPPQSHRGPTAHVDGGTTDFIALLTPREVDFLVTFAVPILTGSSSPLPTYAAVATMWGVSPKTLDNTLQAVKRKMRNAGLVRDEPLEALVRVAVAHSLVARSDLEWANLLNGPLRSAAAGPRFMKRA